MKTPNISRLLAVSLAPFWLVAAFFSFRSNVHDGYDDVPHHGEHAEGEEVR